MQRAVRRPPGLPDGLVVPARRSARAREASLLINIGDPEFRAVPRHLRMPPREPGQLRAVGAEPRRGVEIVTGCDDHWRCRWAVDWQHDERGLRFAFRGRVILAYAHKSSARRIDREVGVAIRSRRRERFRRAARLQPVQPLIRQLRVVDDAAGHRVGIPAVFLDARADIWPPAPGRAPPSRRPGGVLRPPPGRPPRAFLLPSKCRRRRGRPGPGGRRGGGGPRPGRGGTPILGSNFRTPAARCPAVRRAFRIRSSRTPCRRPPWVRLR